MEENEMTTLTLSKESEQPSFQWRLFLLLIGLGAVGLLASIPYGLTSVGKQLSLSEAGLLGVQFVTQIVVLAVQSGLGLVLSRRIGLGAPMLSAWVEGRTVDHKARKIGLAALLGVVAGFAIMILDVSVFAPRLQAELSILQAAVPETTNPPAWQGFLASFYGGINEEIMMRLFLLTLIAWVGTKLSRRSDGNPGTLVMWIATVLAGLALGAAHLPAAISMGIPLTPLYTLRVMMLNLCGVLFGWLYWKKGLESAMVAHFAADVVIHVVAPLLLG
jgi:hypothetical protein